MQALPSVHALPSLTGVWVHTPAPLQPSAVQGFLSSQSRPLTALHAPARQRSPTLHALPSSRVVPSAALVFEQPEAGLQLSLVHALPSLHASAGPPVQAPVWQESLVVHALPSLHALPSALFGCEQVPLAGLQTPATWHWSCAVQVTGLLPVHAPAWHASVWVQPLPSLHDASSALFGLEQAPVPVSHTPTAWHWSSATHDTGLAPAQAPAWHASLCVQALPSLHVVPSALFGLEQAPLAGLQTPAAWH